LVIEVEGRDNALPVWLVAASRDSQIADDNIDLRVAGHWQPRAQAGEKLRDVREVEIHRCLAVSFIGEQMSNATRRFYLSNARCL
jgi:hypothetical protein